MKIDKIKDILSGYGSEKGFDFVISAVRELSKKKRLKENINNLIRLELSTFENIDKDGEYDFQGLIDLLNEFGSESFIESYVYAYIESDSLDNKKELIRKECIRDTKANTQESEQSVRRIVDRCFSIVDEHLLSCLSKEDLIQARVIIKNIEEALKQQTESIKEILQTYFNELTTLFTLQASSTTYHACPSPTNDNQAYLDAFTNPLFLENEEEDENVLSLADMYISPSIKGKDIKASECVKKWYNTKTKPCLLLYGNAGVGKSSFVSKILADANGKTEKSKVEFDFDSSKVMAVALRNHTDKINIQLKAEEILATLFNYDSAEQLKDKLLILDGLDELCVLKRGFEGKKFVEKLSKLEYGFHVLVTSRESESYFTEPDYEEGLKTERLVWEEKQIKDWLELYKAKKPDKQNWCDIFYKKFSSFEDDDERRVIFTVPMILYICGTSKTDIEDYSSIGSIYRDSFTKILLRKHLKGQSNISEFKKADQESNITAWQFTKELAYQMFLLTTLDLIDDDASNDRRAVGFRNAKKRTKDILKEEYKIEAPNLEVKRELAVCPFARENEKGGITFAHKTVYEYFTAVKLYEDYFVKFDNEYFKTTDNDTAAKEVMESFIEAFRYEFISEDIFNYLCKMNGKAFSGDYISNRNSNHFEYEFFERSLRYGMRHKFYATMQLKKATEEYLYPDFIISDEGEVVETIWMDKSLISQLSHAFANITWFITLHGFKNKEKEVDCMEIGRLIHSNIDSICCRKWYMKNAYLGSAFLERADFSYADLSEAVLSDAELTSANLVGANLSNSKMVRTNLTGADLSNAVLDNSRLCDAKILGATLHNTSFINADLTDSDLRSADLTDADLTGAYLINADLTDANLTGTKLENTKYSTISWCETKFPEGFEPKEHNMKEVNVLGELVENE